MRTSKEIKINRIELTPKQYGELVGIGEAAARARCEQGLVSAYRTEGGHWKIIIHKDDAVSRDEHERVLKENAELRAIIDGIKKLTG